MTIYVCSYFKSIKWLLPDDLCVLGSFESLEKERAERASERARFIGENCGRLSLDAADVSWKKEARWMGIVGSLWHAAKGIALDPILECNGEPQISSESSSFVASARREAFINVRGASVGGTHTHAHVHDWLVACKTHAYQCTNLYRAKA